jgi:hypothetical protein
MDFGRFMMKQGVFTREEIGFGRVTDDPAEAVDLVVRSLPPVLRARLGTGVTSSPDTGEPH